MADVQQLINNCNNQYLTVTGPDEGQCTAVAHKWSQMNGLPIVYGDAANTFDNAPDAYYDKILNTPTNAPIPGDTIVWHQNNVVGTGPVGHTAVCVSADANHFTSFDQNWPTGSRCRLVYHTYDGVTGWFRPKITQAPQGGGEDMIADADNEYWRWNKLFMQVRGREASREEFRNAAVGRSWLSAIEILSDNEEASNAQHAQEVGQVAVRDQWDQQIYGLTDRLNEALKVTSELSAQIVAQGAQIKDLQAKLAIAGKNSKDTVQLNKLGEALRWAIARLGLKG